MSLWLFKKTVIITTEPAIGRAQDPPLPIPDGQKILMCRYLSGKSKNSLLCTTHSQFLEILLSRICPWVIVHYSPFDKLRANGFCLWFIVHRLSSVVLRIWLRLRRAVCSVVNNHRSSAWKASFNREITFSWYSFTSSSVRVRSTAWYRIRYDTPFFPGGIGAPR